MHPVPLLDSRLCSQQLECTAQAYNLHLISRWSMHERAIIAPSKNLEITLLQTDKNLCIILIIFKNVRGKCYYISLKYWKTLILSVLVKERIIYKKLSSGALFYTFSISTTAPDAPGTLNANAYTLKSISHWIMHGSAISYLPKKVWQSPDFKWCIIS